MNKIYKYQLGTVDTQSIIMKQGYKILDLQLQRGIPCVWVLIDPNNNNSLVEFRTYATGQTVDERSNEYIGSYQLYGGDAIFHVFI